MSSDPVRTCVGCRQRAAKHDLLRVVLDDRDGHREVVPDPTGRAPGRGAHLHPTPECLDLARRRRAWGRALRDPGGTGLDTARLAAFVSDLGSTGAGPSTTKHDQQESARPAVTDQQWTGPRSTDRNGSSSS